MLNKDVEFMLERLPNQAGTNQCVVSFNEKCCKIEREDYSVKDDGLLIFKAKRDWSDEGFSVSEMVELLHHFKDKIVDVKFETQEGSIENLLNIFEVDNIGNVGEFNCLLIVGKPGGVLKLYNNSENTNFVPNALDHYF